ncbi:hypothetical protein [Amycolatopsis echigonensis]|uniref:hypothetical protein n=1 Tax=Amycolatopsis echigonensis TaxID=2576905 RepID=UPI001FCA2C94|nr:hypothetical protein [Amycolatopsis niigatensis]
MLDPDQHDRTQLGGPADDVHRGRDLVGHGHAGQRRRFRGERAEILRGLVGQPELLLRLRHPHPAVSAQHEFRRGGGHAVGTGGEDERRGHAAQSSDLPGLAQRGKVAQARNESQEYE